MLQRQDLNNPQQDMVSRLATHNYGPNYGVIQETRTLHHSHLPTPAHLFNSESFFNFMAGKRYWPLPMYPWKLHPVLPDNCLATDVGVFHRCRDSWLPPLAKHTGREQGGSCSQQCSTRQARPPRLLQNMIAILMAILRA